MGLKTTSEYEDPLTDKFPLTFVNSNHRSEQREQYQKASTVSQSTNDYYSEENSDVCYYEAYNSQYFDTKQSTRANVQPSRNSKLVCDYDNFKPIQVHNYQQSAVAIDNQESTYMTNSGQLIELITQLYTARDYYDQLIQYYINYNNYSNNYNNYDINPTSTNYEYSLEPTTYYRNYQPCLDQSLNFQQEKLEKHEPEKQLPVKDCRKKVSKFPSWKGVLPKRAKFLGEKLPVVYSRKVFVGGVPWDITEEQLVIAFGNFGNFTVQWPTREQNRSSENRIKGYVYLIFDIEESVQKLIYEIKDTGKEMNGGSVTFNYRIKCNRNKHVQIVPWLLSDNFWKKDYTGSPKDLKTVFVGGLHGKLYAQALFAIFEELFCNVVSVKIDTDEFDYPTGSGSITFCRAKSYKNAINANYIEVQTSTFGPKKIEIQHFMEDKTCSVCDSAPGKKFCKTECFEYFCEICWKNQHSTSQHVAVSRHHRSKDNSLLSFNENFYEQRK